MMQIVYTTDFVKKTRAGDGSRWEEDVVEYYECPNCGEITENCYGVEERGEGVHTLPECFAILRGRIERLERDDSDVQPR